jgi:hypothetical protein
MKLRLFKVQTEPGFRLSLADLSLLAILGGLSAWLRISLPENSLWPLPAYIGMSFFLFCNVFRVGNNAEAFWYIPFVACVLTGINFPDRLWWIILAVCEPVRVAVIAYRILKGPYRGIFARSRPDGKA